MTDADFLPAILTAPDDDTPRLIYADWLEEHGGDAGRARAEFIRVQCRLAEMDEAGEGVIDPEEGHTCVYDPCPVCALVAEYERLKRRERKLLDGPRPAIYQPEVVWFNGGDGTETWKILFRPTWRRGFVEAVTCSGGDWLAHADALLSQQPIREVTLLSAPHLEEKTAADFLAPPGWVMGYSIGRKSWRWETLGRPATVGRPLSRHIVGLILEAEWPSIYFTAVLPG